MAACGPGLPGEGTDLPLDVHPYQAAIPKTQAHTHPEAQPSLGATWSCLACHMSPPESSRGAVQGEPARAYCTMAAPPEKTTLGRSACNTFPSHTVPI